MVEGSPRMRGTGRFIPCRFKENVVKILASVDLLSTQDATVEVFVGISQTCD